MDAFARMLVAVDGSSAADAAARLGLEIARTRPQGKLRFVTVVEHDDRAALDAARALARTAGIDAEAALRTGHPVDEILAEALAWDATCIVLGTHGRSGLPRTLFGSCAEGVLRSSDRPVLVARDTLTRPGSLARVLCAFDGSGAAQRAFEAAVTFAAERDAELHVVSVVQLDDLYAGGYEGDGFDPDGSIGALYDDARRALKTLAADAVGHGARVALHVAGGTDVASVVASCATRYGCGLILMGTHGRRGIGRAVLGSTAEAVIRDGAVPVLAFHERSPAHDSPGARAAIPHGR